MKFILQLSILSIGLTLLSNNAYSIDEIRERLLRGRPSTTTANVQANNTTTSSSIPPIRLVPPPFLSDIRAAKEAAAAAATNPAVAPIAPIPTPPPFLSGIKKTETPVTPLVSTPLPFLSDIKAQKKAVVVTNPVAAPVVAPAVAPAKVTPTVVSPAAVPAKVAHATDHLKGIAQGLSSLKVAHVPTVVAPAAVLAKTEEDKSKENTLNQSLLDEISGAKRNLKKPLSTPSSSTPSSSSSSANTSTPSPFGQSGLRKTPTDSSPSTPQSNVGSTNLTGTSKPTSMWNNMWKGNAREDKTPVKKEEAPQKAATPIEVKNYGNTRVVTPTIPPKKW